MILNYVIYKRDQCLTMRIPESVKKGLEKLANSKGISRSEYVLNLILADLEKENILISQSSKH